MRKHNFNFPENNQFVYVIVLWDVFHLMYVMEGRSREWSERKKWYECCFKNNTSYFILSAHDIRGGCWWYSSRSWTFLPIFHYILLLCDRWQQRGRLTKWCLTWEGIWSQDVSLNSSMCKKMSSLAFVNACWMFMETKQWMWAQWGSGWCFSSSGRDSVSPLLVQIFEHGIQALV